MNRHNNFAARLGDWSISLVGPAVIVGVLGWMVGVQPVLAVDKCKDFGLPSFKCPATATHDVCGTSPFFYCFSGADDACTGGTPAPNYIFDCESCSCKCDTANFPCAGCAATSVTPGGNCSPPNNGKYANGCPESCTCPSGTTRCISTNTCVTNQSCPTGMTFDPCLPGCVTPYILRSPATVQANAFINIDGNVKTGGDLYMADGKAVRLDSARATVLNIGNWGGGSFAVRAFGALTADGRIGSGAPSPAYRLDIVSGTDTQDILNLNDQDGNAASRVWTGTRLARESTEKWYIGMNATSDDLLMSRNGGGVGNTSIFVSNATGDVGVGTTNPTGTLSVGNGAVTLFSVDGATGDVVTAGNLAVNGGNLTTTAGIFNIAGTASTVNLGGGAASTGCTLDADGNLVCAGTITSSGSGGGGAVGYWQRGGTTLSPATTDDTISTGGNIMTTGSGSITSNGNLTVKGVTVLGDNPATDTLTLNLLDVLVPGGLSIDAGTLYVDPVNNRVGISQTIPGYRFDVSADNDSTAIVRINDDRDGNTATRLWTGTTLSRESLEKWFLGMNGTDDDFTLNRNGGGSALTVLNSNGYVGIGTDDPASRLDVNGTVTSTGIALAGDYTQTSGNFTFSGGGTFSTSAANTTLGTTNIVAGKTITLGAAAGDPAGANGAMYYNTTTNNFRCFQGGGWTDCYSDGAAVGSGVNGQVVFWTDTRSVAGDNGFFWDNITKRLGLGTVSPAYPLDIRNDGATGTTEMRLNNDNATRLWTGTALSRQSSEKWFIGMNSSNDDLSITRNGDTTSMLSVSNATGDVTVTNNLAVNGGTISTTAATFNLAPSATTVNIGGGSGSTGCSVDVNGNLICSGTISSGGGGAVGYWQRAGTTLSPATAGDVIATSGDIQTTGAGNIQTTGTGGITSNGNLSVKGNTTLGDAFGDTLTISGQAVNIPSGLLFGGNALFLSNNTKRVAIGAASASYRLDIVSANDSQVIMRLNDDKNYPTSRLYTGTTLSRAGTEKWFLGMNSTDDDFTLNRNAGASSSFTVLNSNGNVGIGTDNPAQPLDVNGTAQVAGFKMPTGAAAGKVLMSDANGVGT